MVNKKLNWWKSIIAFLFVLFMMPLGHALMIIMEHTLNESALHYCAFAMGAVGIILAAIGVFAKGDTEKTLLGLAGGMLFWTGWVEFLFQYYANRYGTQPQLDPLTGAVVTKPEYLILPASFGFWTMIIFFYIFSKQTGCNFIRLFQKLIFRKNIIERLPKGSPRNSSVVTFMELTMIMWSSYLLLMFCYDPNFIGDSHPITFIVGLACFIGSLFTFFKQLRLRTWGANIRMAIPTVILFWTPIEILGRNNFFNEIWIAPQHHVMEMLAILIAFIILTFYLLFVHKTISLTSQAPEKR